MILTAQGSFNPEGGSLPRKRSHTKRTKFGPREGVFHIRATRKMGRGQGGRRNHFSRGPNVKNSFSRLEFRSLRSRTLATKAKRAPTITHDQSINNSNTAKQIYSLFSLTERNCG